MSLKPQDLVVVLKLAIINGERPSFSALGLSLGISSSEVHAGVKRATKAGLLGLTRSLAREIASRGITVNAVSPGFIETDMTAGLTDETRAALLATIPLGRAGAPADVAETVAFLASDAAAYITGQVLRVNGGLYI